MWVGMHVGVPSSQLSGIPIFWLLLGDRGSFAWVGVSAGCHGRSGVTGGNDRRVPSNSCGRTGIRCGGVPLQHSPVKEEIELVSQGAEKNPEKLTKVHIIWGLFETKTSTVVEVHCELSREAFAQCFYRG